jgi:hypothetical protein
MGFCGRLWPPRRLSAFCSQLAMLGQDVLGQIVRGYVRRVDGSFATPCPTVIGCDSLQRPARFPVSRFRSARRRCCRRLAAVIRPTRRRALLIERRNHIRRPQYPPMVWFRVAVRIFHGRRDLSARHNTPRQTNRSCHCSHATLCMTTYDTLKPYRLARNPCDHLAISFLTDADFAATQSTQATNHPSYRSCRYRLASARFCNSGGIILQGGT